MLRRLLPQSTDFFQFFEQLSLLMIKTCQTFLELTSTTGDKSSLAVQIKDLEHQADDVSRQCIEAIHKTFITPIDRNDIHHLIRRMDDIVDAVDSATARLILYEIDHIRPEAQDLAKVLVKASTEIELAVQGLRDSKKTAITMERCIAIHQLENEGDDILKAALSRLFKEESNAVLVIKWKEIFERLEKATDRCEAVANIIEGVIIEAS